MYNFDENKEIWDLYDADEKPKGTFVRGKGQIPDGLYHKTVEVIPTDMEGHILLTRRSMNKKRGAGLLEFPSGSVISGEKEEQTAVRELNEETGLRPKKIYLLQKTRSKGIIRYTYLAYIPDMMRSCIRYSEDEVMGHLFVNYDKWLHLVASPGYNQDRLRGYGPKLFTLVRELTNKYAKPEEEAVPHKAPKAPLRRSETLSSGKAPKHLDERCYQKDDFVPEPEDLEPEIEEGDDGT